MDSAAWKIEWSDDLSMSNPEIDAEHLRFVERVNELNRAIVDRKDKSEIVQIMTVMLKEAVEHFAHEERLFEENDFPGAEDHSRIHIELTEKLNQALKTIQESEFGREWIEVGLTIKGLLVEHVLEEDTQYIDYLRSD